MLLRSALIIFVLISAGTAKAEDVPGLKASVYKLKSLVKIFKGVRKESRANRTQFCGERISPKLKTSGEKQILNFSASLAFEWGDVNDPTPDPVGGCRYPVTQKIDKTSSSTRLVLINTEECERGQPVTGSQRETLLIDGHEITYSSEKVVKTDSGEWRADDTKESFVCTWTAD